MIENDLITQVQAAKLYGCTRAGINYHIKEGNLRKYMVGKKVYVNKAEVENLAKRTKPRGVKRSKTREGPDREIGGDV